MVVKYLLEFSALYWMPFFKPQPEAAFSAKLLQIPTVHHLPAAKWHIVSNQLMNSVKQMKSTIGWEREERGRFAHLGSKNSY